MIHIYIYILYGYGCVVYIYIYMYIDRYNSMIDMCNHLENAQIVMTRQDLTVHGSPGNFSERRRAGRGSPRGPRGPPGRWPMEVEKCHPNGDLPSGNLT